MSVSRFPAPAGKTKTVERFTATGSWVAPANVTYAIASITAGGGGAGGSGNYPNGLAFGGDGGTSSVLGESLAGGRGGGSIQNSTGSWSGGPFNSGQVNTGQGGDAWSNSNLNASGMGGDSRPIFFGSEVTPGTSYPVVIGAGGSGGATSGTFGAPTGGSGVVEIEYWIG